MTSLSTRRKKLLAMSDLIIAMKERGWDLKKQCLMCGVDRTTMRRWYNGGIPKASYGAIRRNAKAARDGGPFVTLSCFGQEVTIIPPPGPTGQPEVVVNPEPRPDADPASGLLSGLEDAAVKALTPHIEALLPTVFENIIKKLL